MKRALTLAPLLMLGGCISLLPPPPPPPRLYVLEADAQTPPGQGHVDAVLSVAPPTGERSILNTDLVWRTDDQLAFVSGSQWSSRADIALQSLLVSTLQRQGGFRAVTRQGEARGDYELRWEVLDFEVVESSMTARFTANVSLLALPGRRIVAQHLIEGTAPVADRSSSIAAQALARAARDGSMQIGDFAVTSAAAAQASAASINR